MKKEERSLIIIFGATGDLTKRKLIPALYQMYAKESIDKKTPVLCVSRRNYTTDAYIKHLKLYQFIPEIDKEVLKAVEKNIHYHALNFMQDKHKGLVKLISDIQKKHRCEGNTVFYLATPASLFKTIISIIKKNNLLTGKGWRRVCFEKPFGYDLKSAQKLNECIYSVFREDQIYRIDHYLGKELVQNILVFRFANSMYEQIWNKDYIDNIQITISEEMGIETRGGYYEKTGAIRDMVQNHIIQVLSLVTMEPPRSLDADSIRDEKVKIIRSLRKAKPSDIVIGQYGKGIIGKKRVVGYRKEEKIASGSTTETFCALRMFIENRRWDGVPIYVRTGKRLSSRYAEVNVVLKNHECLLLFGKECGKPNLINIRIQPDDGISIRFNTKKPGHGMHLETTEIDFCYRCLFGVNTPDAYETLLREVLIGDQTLFTRWDGIESSWRFIDPIIRTIAKQKKTFPNYYAGSHGPKAAFKLLRGDNREWINLQEKNTNILV